ncbi:hypothetical protein SHKM778_82530 [Streptomyces sp. KM77-8]|uniref:Uncharacterized protein n=1 Tax=Streptomyces haneummycinicus TaxID=3074435 RepID=A0AAT9HWE7_9ACTN
MDRFGVFHGASLVGERAGVVAEQIVQPVAVSRMFVDQVGVVQPIKVVPRNAQRNRRERRP